MKTSFTKGWGGIEYAKSHNLIQRVIVDRAGIIICSGPLAKPITIDTIYAAFEKMGRRCTVAVDTVGVANISVY